MPQQVPSVGRVVHYVSWGSPGSEFKGGEHRAAIITEVYPTGSDVIDMDKVGICVLSPTGLWFNRHTPFDPLGQERGSWHWPEHVPALPD